MEYTLNNNYIIIVFFFLKLFLLVYGFDNLIIILKVKNF